MRTEATCPDDERNEELFDEFLDRALEGAEVDPAAFLEAHGCDDEALRERLAALHAELRRGGPSAPASETAEPGLPFARVGRFRLLRRLDEGGMGTVFVAEQEGLGRHVALKVVRAELRGSEPAAARFDREVQTLAKLRHPNVVTVLEAGREGDLRYLAMEYVEGRDLDAVLEEARARGAPLSPARVVRWGEKLARALAATHARGVIHRDVKPSNIRITPDDEPTLLDFGIAHEQGTAGLTLTGPFVGTPLYAAPEQISGTKGHESDARVDVYGLGATLYECLTGRTPRPGGTVDQVLHHALHEDPVPPRRLVPALSRDLETVVMKALERDPARRYASAAAFAEDLLALVEMRPVRARPPGALRRLAQWGRAHRVAATALGLVATAAVAAASVVVAREVADRTERREEAHAVLEEARRTLAAMQAKQQATLPLEIRIADTLRWSESHHLGPEAEDILWRHQAEVARLQLEREQAFHGALALVRRAERLDPGLPGTNKVRGELYVERWREATRRRRVAEAEYYRNAALALDADGAIRETLIGTGYVTVTSDPPGAEVYLFRYRELSEIEEHGARRFVPVPVGAPSPHVAPGRFALRVVRDAGALVAEDVVVAVEGEEVTRANVRELWRRARPGTRVTVVQGAEKRELELPAGAELRPTAAPLAAHPGCRLGATPIVATPVEPGSFVALVRTPGREARRVAFAVGPVAARPTHALSVSLHAAGTTPAGFTLVEGPGISALATDVPQSGATAGSQSFWMMEREVTCAEYLEFLNAPETRQEIEASPVPIRFPRDRSTAGSGGWWPRSEDGRYAIADDWEPDWPVVGVSYQDAEAYAVWYGARLGRDDLEVALPTYREWVTAGEGSSDRDYVFGNVFWPGWVSSCFAQPTPNIEPVLSYPIDESPMAVYDMSGSAAEWLDDWWGAGKQHRRLGGGSWAQARRDLFKVSGGSGDAPAAAGGESGFRLVARRRDGGAR